MARIKHKSLWYARSSTLIEVITALIIISTVFSLAILIYLNVQKSGLYRQRLMGSAAMDEVYSTMLKEKKYESEQIDYDNFVVYLEVKKGESDSGLLIIRLEVRDKSGKLLAEQKHLLYVIEEP